LGHIIIINIAIITTVLQYCAILLLILAIFINNCSLPLVSYELGVSHPRVAAGIKENAMIVRENSGNLARLIIRENFGDLGNLVAVVGNSLI
jgi:hypothetical protein